MDDKNVSLKVKCKELQRGNWITLTVGCTKAGFLTEYFSFKLGQQGLALKKKKFFLKSITTASLSWTV